MIQKEKERKGKPANIYIIHWKAQSLGLDVLELPRLVKEVVGISLGHKPALIRLLHKVFVALLLSKGNGILLALELEVGALHSIGGRLPAHEGVLPPVTLLQNVPIHPPVVSVPGARLGSRLCGAVDSIKTEGLAIEFLARGSGFSTRAQVPDSAGLEVGRGTRENSSGQSRAGFAAIHHALGNWGELAARQRKTMLASGIRPGSNARCRTRWLGQW